MYIYAARTDVLPGKVRFDCARPMFCEILRVVHLLRWMTKNYSLISTHFINTIIMIMIMIIMIMIMIIINIISIIIPKP